MVSTLFPTKINPAGLLSSVLVNLGVNAANSKEIIFCTFLPLYWKERTMEILGLFLLIVRSTALMPIPSFFRGRSEAQV
jgi:hypothetical protein